MKILVFDLKNHWTFHYIGQVLRKNYTDIHDVHPTMEHLPTGNYQSSIDDIWYTGIVATKLADMFSSHMVQPNTEFILDTTLTFLNTSVTILSNEQGISVTLTDFRTLL